MKVILSDIHGNLEALSSVIKDVKSLGIVSQWIFLGDIVDYGADSLRVLDCVLGLPSICCIRGNHEDALLRGDCSRFTTSYGRLNFEITRKEFADHEDSLHNLQSICQKFTRPLCDYVVITHGTLGNPLWGKHQAFNQEISSGVTYDLTGDIIFCGHTHLQGMRKVRKEYLINPGSVGQPRNGDPRAQYAICDDDFTRVQFRRVTYDVDRAAQKIQKSGRPDFLATRLYLGI